MNGEANGHDQRLDAQALRKTLAGSHCMGW